MELGFKNLKSKKIHLTLLCLIPVQLFVLNFFKDNPVWVEKYYSAYLYPLIYKTHYFFFERFSYPIGDLLYSIGIIFIPILILNLFRKKLSIGLIFINITSFFSLVFLIFNLNWGLNYYRLPLSKKINLDIEYNKTELINTLKYLVQSTNLLHLKLTKDRNRIVKVSNKSDQIIEMICKEFHFFQKFEQKVFLKKSLWSNLLNYMGFAGYLNPFTLESNINLNIPKLNFIVTAAHEMAHQVGFASESEANFIAFITCFKNSDPHIRYAGLTFALNYCYSTLSKIDPIKAKKYMKLLNPGVLESYKEISRFWSQYKNPLEPIIKKSYDSYLKANGQSMGIESYDGMVGLVIGYIKNNNLVEYKFD